MGSERIASRLNPELVEAVEALDRLEAEEDASDMPVKRTPANDDDDASSSRDAKRTRHDSPPLPALLPPPQPFTAPLPLQQGILSSEAIQGLRTLAASSHAQKLLPSKPSPLLGLADYGSDHDSS